jgi:hypothetical protein
MSAANDSSEMVRGTDWILPSWTLYSSVATRGAMPRARVGLFPISVLRARCPLPLGGFRLTSFLLFSLEMRIVGNG